MSTERDTARIVRSWLENGVTDLPDRVLDTVLEQLPATPQRHPWWSARRYLRINNPLKLAIAAGAVFTAGIIGFNLLPGATGPGVGAPASASPSPVASPSPRPSASPGSPAVGTGPLSPGRHFLDVALFESAASTNGSFTRVPSDTARVSFDLPASWTVEEGFVVMKNGAEPPEGMGVLPLTIDRVYIDPCRWSGAGSAGRGVADPPLMRSLDGLAEALTAFWGVGFAADPSKEPGATFPPTRSTATKPANVTLDGRDARYVEVRTPADLDIASCDGAKYVLFAEGDGQRWVQGPGELDRLWIVDVEGTGPETPGGMLVIDAPSHPGTTPADLAEQQAVIDSIRIELLAGS